MKITFNIYSMFPPIEHFHLNFTIEIVTKILSPFLASCISCVS